MQIQISWLLQKPTDLDLHCLQRKEISGFSRTKVIMVAGVLRPLQHCFTRIKKIVLIMTDFVERSTILGFMSLSTLFNSCPDEEGVIMKGSVQ